MHFGGNIQYPTSILSSKTGRTDDLGTFYFSVLGNNWTMPQNDALWQDDMKTLFDPCPAGWRVPRGGRIDEACNPWVYFTVSNSSWHGLDNLHGRHWDQTIVIPSQVWYPAAGYRKWSTGYCAFVGLEALSLSTTQKHDLLHYLYASPSEVNAGGYQGGYARSSSALSVRCLRE